MVTSAVRHAIIRVSSVARYFLDNLKRRTGHPFRSLAMSRSYKILDSMKIIPENNSTGTADDKYPGDQYSQIEIDSASATAARWTGVAVRIGDSLQNAYVGICKTSHGTSKLILFKRMHCKWIQLSRTYHAGPFTDGTQLRLVALGSTIAFMENDIIRIAASDNSLSDGTPGVMVNGAETKGKSSVGSASCEVHHLSDDSRGIANYGVISVTNSGGPHLLRVLRPARPSLIVRHNFLFLLPVEESLKSIYGDGLHILQSLDVQNEYNVTIIEPSFGIESWYADNPNDSNIRHETFMTMELIPWVRATLEITGNEQNWLLGFSKSGIEAQALLLRHPDLFDLAASWDFPADMSAHDEYSPDSAACYSTDANFQTNYRLTSQFVDARRTPFLQDCRIWIGQGPVFANGFSKYESILTAAGVRYAAGAKLDGPHRGDGGWLPAALAALHECSIERGRTASCDI